MRQSKTRRRRGGQPGPKALKLSEIPVVDKNGDRVTVYEREIREPIPVTRTERKHVCYELSSGERVQLIDQETFILTSTGATFVRVPK